MVSRNNWLPLSSWATARVSDCPTLTIGQPAGTANRTWRPAPWWHGEVEPCETLPACGNHSLKVLCCMLGHTCRILEVMADDDIALCLTPQAFHNVNVSRGHQLSLVVHVPHNVLLCQQGSPATAGGTKKMVKAPQYPQCCLSSHCIAYTSCSRCGALAAEPQLQCTATCLLKPLLCPVPCCLLPMQPQTDIFNNLNLSFWEYMLPGTDAYRFGQGGGGVLQH
jgi:hypothetical protein